ncbi:hypothetical protein PIB30_014130 [Stylosanthes scabra]|uniref:Uncharacterized protein n=1 Tax=Stylosanthes scabra TaxID=79078 RepID=A0ABU6T6D5_9FABA|nr:hypothetical protein [Stylosanthes scabra]
MAESASNSLPKKKREFVCLGSSRHARNKHKFLQPQAVCLSGNKPVAQTWRRMNPKKPPNRGTELNLEKCQAIVSMKQSESLKEMQSLKRTADRTLKIPSNLCNKGSTAIQTHEKRSGVQVDRQMRKSFQKL